MATLERRLAALETRASGGNELIVIINKIVSPGHLEAADARMERWTEDRLAEHWERTDGESEDDFRSRVVRAVSGRLGVVVLRSYGDRAST